MSKYNLTELLSEVKGGRIGTLNITAMDLERKMEELEDEGIKVNTFDGDNFGKTYIEYHVHPENKYDPDESFSIYDYKFGEDPTDIDNVDKEYPFSIGGMSAALNSAKALLGAGQASYSIDEGEAVDLAIEASQEKAGIEVDESFKSLAKKLDKQKGIDKDEAAKIAGSIAAKKAAGAGKGPTAKQKKRMTEVRIDRDVAERIEGMLSIPLKRKFLDAFMDLWQDLIEEDPFYAEDVINHLNNEMHREIDGFQAQGDRLAGLGENLDDLNDDEYDDGPNGKFVKEINIDKVASPDAKAHDYGAEIKGISDEDDTEEAYAHQTVLPLEEDDYTDRKGRALYPILKAGANATGDEVEMYVQSLSKDIELNGKEQYREFTADDFVEDFKNYIADKSLQEHFKRFM